MTKTYSPNVNYRVKLDEHEGWVYFVSDDYCTIEIGVKPKSCTLGTSHKMDHILLVCYKKDWNRLEYIRRRKTIHDS